MGSRPRYLLVGALELAMLAGLVYFARVMAPIKEGTSPGFWMSACQVDVTGEMEDQRDEWPGGFYSPREGWYIYYQQGFHGQFLHRIRRSQAVPDFPNALERLEAAVSAGKVGPFVAAGYRAWKLHGGQAGDDPEGLFAEIREAGLAHWRGKDEFMVEYVLTNERDFEARWRCVNRYWANIFFEFVYLTGLIVFVAWPWLRRKSARSWAIHLGLAPLLLFLPYFLGYAEFTFTSAGPSGGVLYPWLILWFYPFNTWTSLDTVLCQITPRVLGPLSQPLGPMLSLSGGGFGRIATLGMGLGLAVLALGLGRVLRLRAARHPQATGP